MSAFYIENMMSEKIDNTVVAVKRERNSNIELLRIITMFFIIAHHYFGESQVSLAFDWKSITSSMFFLQTFGMWGKTGINIFVLISGYYLCTSHLKWQHFFKLWFQIKFYRIFIYALTVIFGFCAFSSLKTIKLVFDNLVNANNSFCASFLFFYMFVPFYNLLLKNVNKRQLFLLICGLLLYFTIADTFFLAKTMNEPFWYMTLYFIAAYLHLYPSKLTTKINISVWFLIISLLLSLASVLVIDYLHIHVGGLFVKIPPEYFVWYNKILSPVVAVAMFLLFKNLPDRHNKTINKVATTCFGVFLLHTSCYPVWGAFLHANDMLNFPFIYLVLHAFCFVLILYVLGILFDFLYQHLIQRFVMNFVNCHSKNIECYFSNLVNRILKFGNK